MKKKIFFNFISRKREREKKKINKLINEMQVRRNIIFYINIVRCEGREIIIIMKEKKNEYNNYIPKIFK